jgi:hypothetical protein
MHCLTRFGYTLLLMKQIGFEPMCRITDLQSVAINPSAIVSIHSIFLNTLGIEPKIYRLKAECFTN